MSTLTTRIENDFGVSEPTFWSTGLGQTQLAQADCATAMVGTRDMTTAASTQQQEGGGS